MKLNSVLLFGCLSVFFSCRAQNQNAESAPKTTIQPGDIATDLDKSIWIVFQDKSNNYWFGSDGQGVYRYDGKTLTHFTTKHGLPGNRIREIQEDKAGNIYINTLDGFSKFDGKTFTLLRPIESNEWKLEADDLWFKGNSIENGPYRYDGQSLYHLKFPKHYLEDEYFSRNPNSPSSPYGVYTIYRDSKGNRWFGTAALGVCRYNGQSLSWLYEEHLTKVENGGSFGIRSVMEDKEGKFWFCNTRYRYATYPDDSISKGYHFIPCRKEKGIDLLEFHKDQIYFQYIVEDTKRNLWMSTYAEGVWKYDGKTMTHYPVKKGDDPVKIVSIYKDNRGDLWLGTEEEGAYLFNGKTFEKFRL